MTTDEFWWADNDLMYAAQRAAVDVGEAPPIDWSTLEEVLALWAAETPGIVSGTVGPSAAVNTEFLDVGAVPLSGYAQDQVTGQIVDVTPDDSGISPLIPYPGHPGSRVNPAWVTHKSIVAQGQYNSTIVNIPPPDTVTIFTGPGQSPSWEDVWNWTTEEQRAHMTFLFDGQTISGAELVAVTDIVSASVIKALGGIIGHTVSANAAVQLAIMRHVDALQLTTFGAVVNLEKEISDLRDTNNFLTKVVVPDLQAQITQLRESIPVQIEQAIQANNIRIRDTWIAPLQSGLKTEQDARAAADTSILHEIPGIAKTVAEAAVAPALAGLASVATRVGTLEAEAEQCTKPMCQIMGPNTPLGKLLKALNLLADAALLAELLGMDEKKLIGLIQTIAAKIAELVSDFEQFFAPGGETIGGLISTAIGNVI